MRQRNEITRWVDDEMAGYVEFLSSTPGACLAAVPLNPAARPHSPLPGPRSPLSPLVQVWSPVSEPAPSLRAGSKKVINTSWIRLDTGAESEVTRL